MGESLYVVKFFENYESGYYVTIAIADEYEDAKDYLERYAQQLYADQWEWTDTKQFALKGARLGDPVLGSILPTDKRCPYIRKGEKPPIPYTQVIR